MNRTTTKYTYKRKLVAMKKISRSTMSMMKLILSFLFFPFSYISQAATCTFLGYDVPWNVASNWSGGILPAPGDYIIIPQGKKANITADVLLDPGVPSFISIRGQLDFTQSATIKLAANSGVETTGGTGCLTGILTNNSQRILIDQTEVWASKCNGGHTSPDCGNTCINALWGSIPTLPLTLVSFNLEEPSNNNVLLHWITENEMNIIHFELEKSSDGENWRLASIIIPNSNGIYSFSDEQSFDRYYRLKIINKDNTYTYSPIIISNDKTGEYLISYEGQLKIYTENPEELSIYNVSGINVKNITTQKGLNEITLPNGVYQVMLNHVAVGKVSLY